MTPSNDRKFNLLSNGAVESFWHTLWFELSLFLCFNGRISENRDLASPNDRELNLLSNGGVESFLGALWLDLYLFLYSK